MVIAAALLTKAVVALTARRSFYALRQRQYASETLPPKFLVAPAVILALDATAVYAALLHYRPWGWIVVGFLALLSVVTIDHVIRWPTHRLAMLKVVESPKVWRVDCVLLALGSAFAVLAVFVY